MYTLTNNEIQAFKMYNSLNETKHDSGSYMVACQSLLENIVKEACLRKCKVSVTYIHEGVTVYLDKNSDFINGTNTKGFPEYKPDYKRFKNDVLFINNKANDFKHNKLTPTEQEADLAKKYTENCLDWYIKIFIGSDEISSSDADAKNCLIRLLPSEEKRERIIERETFYVLLLVDSSQSMLWPFLENQKNWDKDSSSDYKNAIIEVQKAMQFAHEKALNALRGSSICSEGYLQLYQYTFNHRIKLLNPPEVLASSQFSADNVAKINSSNYTPSGKTALYDVIHESLKVVYEKYLKEEMEKESRINKVIIGVITDGEDTVLNSDQKAAKISEIKQYLRILRGNGDIKKNFLISSVLIGLVGNDFTDNKLKEIKKELSFDESISINQADEHSIRKAFKLFSTNAINV